MPGRYAAASMNRWRRHSIVGRGVAIALLAGASCLLSCCGLVNAATPTSGTTTGPTSPYNAFIATEQRAVSSAMKSLHVALPTKPGAPAPVLPANAFGSGLGSKIVLGFLPSWEIADGASIDYSALSEIAYYALEVQPSGAILHSGEGWDTLSSGAVSQVISSAHAAGVRALLTLYTIDQSTLRQLAAHPSTGTTLADQVAPLLQGSGFDGVDLDFEGQIASARAGFVKFFAAFSARLRAINPSWSLVLNVLPQAGADPESFFDVKALAPYADQLFVMAYDMSDQLSPGATAPLEGAALSDVSSLASLVGQVPVGKLLLGIPFYGYDFTATRRTLPADTIGTPYAVTYESIVAAGRPALWDPATETPYSSFRRAGRWHQTWFDDPVSVALKVALAAAFRTGGVGAWELGMANGENDMTVALDGGSPPRRLSLAPHS
jgi:hypothetical protein